MKEKTYKQLALWQRKFIPAIITILTTLATVMGEAWIGIVIVILAGANTALGQLLDSESKDFFSDKEIVNIVKPETVSMEEAQG